MPLLWGKVDRESEQRSLDIQVSDAFWPTIDMLNAKPILAVDLLSNLSEEELQRFYYDYRMLATELYPEYEDEERGLDEDDIASASSWVVAQGKTKYFEVWNDPALLPNPSTVPSTDYSLAAAGAYYNKFGKDIMGRPWILQVD